MLTTIERARSRDFDLSRHFVGTGRPVRSRARELVLVNAGRLASPMAQPGQAVDAVRNLAGPDASFAILDPRLSLGYRDVRGIPWTAFPVLSDPAYRHHPLSIHNRHDYGPDIPPPDGIPVIEREGARLVARCAQPLSSIVGDIEGVIIVPGEAADAQWLLMARMLVRQVIDRRIPVRTWTPSGSNLLGPVEIDALGNEALPRERFEFCYRINFRAIAGKAVAHAMAELGPSDRERLVGPCGLTNPGLGDREDWSTARPEDMARRLEHPVALQALYALRKKGRIRLGQSCVMPDGRVTFPFSHMLGELLAQDPTGGPNHANSVWLWTGSGKHGPTPVNQRLIARFTAAAYFAGFLDLDGREVSLSRVGHIFLDALHPDCEDGDAPCRWNGMSADKAGPSVDRWMMRFFRKMKTRVNRLP